MHGFVFTREAIANVVLLLWKFVNEDHGVAIRSDAAGHIRVTVDFSHVIPYSVRAPRNVNRAAAAESLKSVECPSLAIMGAKRRTHAGPAAFAFARVRKHRSKRAMLDLEALIQPARRYAAAPASSPMQPARQLGHRIGVRLTFAIWVPTSARTSAGARSW